MLDHASDAYLDGLSDLDRARAIVAVRWCDYQWRLDDNGERGLVRSGPHLGEYWRERFPVCESADVPIAKWWNIGHVILSRDWGTNWTGTASLMDLAESRGWRLVLLENADATCCYLRREPDLATCEHTDDTIHAAVLLACAAAAQREVSDE